MRISDWSSDVCSSDLGGGDGRQLGDQADRGEAALLRIVVVRVVVVEAGHRAEHADQHRHRMRFVAEAAEEALERLVQHQIGRASCRERVCPYVSISVGAVTLKKKK